MCPIWQAVGDSSLKAKVPGALQWSDATGLPESDLTQSPSSAPGKSGCVSLEKQLHEADAEILGMACLMASREASQ